MLHPIRKLAKFISGPPHHVCGGFCMSYFFPFVRRYLCLLLKWVFIIFGGISYENWWSTNLRENNSFVFGNKFTFAGWIRITVRVVISICFTVVRTASPLHYMSLFANEKDTAGEVTLRISIFLMMFCHFELVNIFRMVLTKFLQAVGGLLNGFVAIRRYLFTIERVHAVHIFFMQYSSVVAAELFKYIRYTAVDATITNVVRQNGAGNTISIEPMALAYVVRCTVIVGALSRCHKKALWKNDSSVAEGSSTSLLYSTEILWDSI